MNNCYYALGHLAYGRVSAFADYLAYLERRSEDHGGSFEQWVYANADLATDLHADAGVSRSMILPSDFGPGDDKKTLLENGIFSKSYATTNSMFF